MKFSAVFAGALATLVSAAPASTSTSTDVEKRAAFDASQFNNLAFNSLDVGYLSTINSIDLAVLQSLAINNNFNAVAFQPLFQAQVFDVNAILQLQQLQTVVQLGQLGIFNAFDLSALQLNVLNLGVVSNVGAFDLGSLIDASLQPQLTAVAGNSGMSPSSLVPIRSISYLTSIFSGLRWQEGLNPLSFLHTLPYS